MHCKQLTDGIGPLCISCRTDVETLERGINRQCQQCGGYEYDDGTCELCYCDEFDEVKAREEFNKLESTEVDPLIFFFKAARWQHSQDQKIIQDLKKRINNEIIEYHSLEMKYLELEAEIARLKDKHESKFEGRP